MAISKSNARRATVACAFAVITVLFISTSAVAQSDSNPKWDLFAGYQWFHPGGTVPAANTDPNNPTPFLIPDMPKGAGAAFAYNFDKHWAGEVDLGHNWGSGSYTTTASIGPRFMWRSDTVNFFMHGLVGYNRLAVTGMSSRSNGIGAILGGGMDLPITKSFAIRVFEADYVYSRHNFAGLAAPQFPDLRRPTLQGVRLRTGLLFSWGGAEPIAPIAACSVQPAEVMVGEPITATVSASNFNPKHTVTYSWSGNGGQVTGKDTTASIDTTNATPGAYTITAHVTDPKAKKANEASCSANYTIKPLPPKNPPTMSLSASPTELVQGGSVNLSANCTSPDSVPVSVASWTSTLGNVSGSGNMATLNTAGLPAGPVTVTATCTDSRGLNAQASTQVVIQNPPPPVVDKALEARLALHSVYFPTAQPAAKDPSGGLLPGQKRILDTLASDFKKYREAKPDAHLVLEGHADMRGSAAFNQALSERRVARVKSYLIEQGVPEADIETKAFGAQHNLTVAEVKSSIEQSTDLTTEERKRELARMNVVLLASNRRVDVTLNAAGQTETSVRSFPFNATDALSLIGGRESEAKKPAAKRPAKKAVKKP
ncbi:MAG TPA: OmpA family protein [Candidatus Dormibacteraeota bacterium]|nr:OmpA family protein [Candidatus Dormibacteraeota bacterium]